MQQKTSERLSLHCFKITAIYRGKVPDFKHTWLLQTGNLDRFDYIYVLINAIGILWKTQELDRRLEEELLSSLSTSSTKNIDAFCNQAFSWASR